MQDIVWENYGRTSPPWGEWAGLSVEACARKSWARWRNDGHIVRVMALNPAQWQFVADNLEARQSSQAVFDLRGSSPAMIIVIEGYLVRIVSSPEVPECVARAVE